MVKKLLHTRYRVSDLEKTVAFYRDVLGLELTRRHTSPRGSHLVFFKAPAARRRSRFASSTAAARSRSATTSPHLAFEVEDLEAFAKHAAAKGYPLSDGPTPTSSGSVIAFVDAPEGYEIELIQRAP